MSKTCQASVIRVAEDGKSKLVTESIPVPIPGPGQALVRVQYVAQNPTDVKSFDAQVFGDGHIVGCDFYGVVEELGSDVTKISKGDTVAGLIWGGEIKGVGAFSEYTIADQNICYKVPKGISGAAASTVPLACATSWLALFAETCLNIDRSKGSETSLLIWGGSTSVGLFAIQLATIYGIKVVTTCSPRNNDLVRSLGAQHVYDYRDKDVVKKIRSAIPDLHYVFDTVGDANSSATASQAIAADAQGYLCTVRPGKEATEDVTKQTNVRSVLASNEDHELASELFDKLPTWLESGQIKPNPTKVYDGGLKAIPEGFQEYRDGKVSGYKIVYKL